MIIKTIQDHPFYEGDLSGLLNMDLTRDNETPGRPGLYDSAFLKGLHLDGVVWNYGRHDGCRMEAVCLRGATLQFSCFDDAHFQHCDFTDADFYWLSAIGAVFEDCNFTSAQCLGAVLAGATFTRCILDRTQFGPGNVGGSSTLDGCTFTDSNLDTAVLKGCQYDANTRFPPNFNPQAQGMAFVPESDYQY